ETYDSDLSTAIEIDLARTSRAADLGRCRRATAQRRSRGRVSLVVLDLEISPLLDDVIDHIAVLQASLGKGKVPGDCRRQRDRRAGAGRARQHPGAVDELGGCHGAETRSLMPDLARP